LSEQQGEAEYPSTIHIRKEQHCLPLTTPPLAPSRKVAWYIERRASSTASSIDMSQLNLKNTSNQRHPSKSESTIHRRNFVKSSIILEKIDTQAGSNNNLDIYHNSIGFKSPSSLTQCRGHHTRKWIQIQQKTVCPSPCHPRCPHSIGPGPASTVQITTKKMQMSRPNPYRT